MALGKIPIGDIVFGHAQGISQRVSDAVRACQDYLFRQQAPEGYWCGELEADTTLESDYIYLHEVLGTRTEERTAECVREILRHQNDDGGWPIFHGGPSNISATVKAYTALKIAGWSKDDPVLVAARERIFALGGITKINTFSKMYLCVIGQYDYEAVPAIPPEIMLFPKWFWFNIYEISSWSRAILVPLSICYAHKPLKKIPAERGIDELFPQGRENMDLHLEWDKRLISWRNFFLLLNTLVHWFERIHIRPLRKIALRAAEKWMLERLEMSDGLGAIYPGILNSILALRVLGYSLDDPQVIRALDEFEKLGIREAHFSEPTFRMQPCMSPVWDTAYALFALAESGVPGDDPRMVRAAEWMLKKQVTHKGDWAVKVPNISPGGWYFEFNNEFYPDVDDSAMVLLALDKIKTSDERYHYDTCQRALRWIKAMQCKAGGWASFDKDNTKMVFQHIPFADHNAMLDPPTVDITGRVLEMFAQYGARPDEPFVRKALAFVRSEQETDGSWFGRWGVNYIYGTALVLRGLDAMNVDRHDPMVQQAAEWLRSIQNSDGGWGETCGSYDNPTTKGVGPSTPSQTAWAIMGLIAAGDLRSNAVDRGIIYLLNTQRKDGSWDEVEYTGTGFPRVFYLAYHMYRNYFPLIALSAYQRAQSQPGGR
ncbi:MAG: squalene--hopene cyclase [Acidobacteriales bacterium]|nr:squalene--hopene cyclase [Terriglobales bacterium]